MYLNILNQIILIYFIKKVANS